VRGDQTRGQGALALGDDDPVRRELPTALVSVVCRAANWPEPVRVERELEGASWLDFETIELQPGEGQCAQVRDLIPPGTIGNGIFTYEVHLMTEKSEITQRERKFAAVGGARTSRPGP